ncbi:MAG TPA: hypothetical protein ENJ91_11905 [Rhodobacteraceae bacterium]|nr:hypothetical protein [Paracoccaceae bacterium]
MTDINKDLLILVVGDIGHWLSTGRDLPRIAQTRFCDFEELDSGLLKQLNPQIILSPLLGRGFDVLDLVALLCTLGYDGRVRGMTPPLPNPELIRGEVQRVCPELDFDIIEVRPGPILRSV